MLDIFGSWRNGSLPYRQLRNVETPPHEASPRSLPYRQLRNNRANGLILAVSSLPYRQLRNDVSTATYSPSRFTAVQAA